MMSLFTTFDYLFFKLNIITVILVSLLILKPFYKNSKKEFLILLVQNLMSDFFYSLKKKNFSKSKMVMLNSIFFVILMVNFMSIMPFFFSWTSQISLVMFTSLIFWLSYIMFQISKNHKNMLAHFIPAGTPYPLVPFLFMIEMISNLIRPITVSVRLVANILAGHLLMILLSKLVLSSLVPAALCYICLNGVEMAVAMIQSYIFCTMICLYYSEVL